VRLWIDTDIGDNPDDAVALLCAAAHPDVELVGVSTTGGRTKWRAELARQFVGGVVVAGERPDEVAREVTTAAPEAFLAIGPLTNVAALVALDVALPPLTVMGGVLEPVRHRGRLRRVEFNFGRDPAAAAVVVAGTELTLVPLDATVSMRLDAPELAELLAADARLVPEVERWAAEHDDPVVLHDPLALLVACGETLVEVETRLLGVDAHDGTVRESEGGRAHGVVVAVDAPAARRRVVDLLAEMS
jgi:inosine-uridine nucleoside N-ribohydrolase